MSDLKKGLCCLVAIAAVAVGTWLGWRCWDWSRRVDRRLDELYKFSGEFDHRLFVIENGTEADHGSDPHAQ